jgi:hypothetical protein
MACRALVVVCLTAAAAAAGCGKSSTPVAPGPATPTLAAPTASSPGDQAQLVTLRPTLSVGNSPSSGTGARAYEFQVSDRSDFASTSSPGSFPVLARQTGVAEGTGGTTSFTPDFDLQPATHLYWRARMRQGLEASDWTATRSFNTAIVGYNRPGELYDPLIYGNTIGTITGSTSFISGQGIRLNDGFSYVRYQLAAPLSAGEFSLEIAGLHPNGPGSKLKLFAMSDSTASTYNSPWLFTVQYRGLNGNPDNSIAWKMRLGDPAFQLEPDLIDRNRYVVALDPSRFYFFRAMWDNGFRMIVQNAAGAGTFYDLEYASTDYFENRRIPYQPSPHFAYLGSNDQREGPENGTFPGEIVRNVFIGNRPRPASLGSALRAE